MDMQNCRRKRRLLFSFVLLALALAAQSVFAQAKWEALGPVSNPGLGIGRVECIAFDPGYNGTTNKTMYAGSQTGGLWKSTDGGQHWSNSDCSTDRLPFIGVGDIAINPKDSKQLFIAGGTRYTRKHAFPLKIYRSDDGGANWTEASSGIDLDAKTLNCIARILIDPTDVKTLYAATSQGLFKTINSGKKWKQILPGDYHTLEFNPADSKILYAGGTFSTYKENISVLCSRDAGQTWKTLADGSSVFKAKEHLKINLAVSPSRPEVIYVLTANTDALATNDLYVSLNGGKSWTAKTLPYPNDHPDKVALGISPVNPGEIYIGKLFDFYKSSDLLDSNFNKRPMNKRWQTLRIIHSDLHDIRLAPVSGEVFVAHDGGLWNATTNKDASEGLNIATLNYVSTSETKTDFAIAGMQDCGTNLYDGSLKEDNKWKNVLGGDGQEVSIDYNNEKYIVSAAENLGTAAGYGPNKRSMDGGKTFSPLGNPSTADFKKSNAGGGPLLQDPEESEVYYFGYSQLYKATFTHPDSSNSMDWEQLTHISDLKPFSILTGISVNGRNTKIIYAGFVHGRIFKTTSGGDGLRCSKNCWTEVSPFKNLGYFNYVSLTQNPADPDKVWAAYTGTNMFSADPEDSATLGNAKVMYSEDGGGSWTEYGRGLPPGPVYVITCADKSLDLLFAGTESGLYYRSSRMKQWQVFGTELPRCIVRDIRYNEHEKTLYAATYGRGLWKVSLSDLLKHGM